MSFSWFKSLPASKRKGLTFLLIGIFFLLAAFSLKGYQEIQQNVLSFSQTPELSLEVSEEDLPNRIIASAVGIDVLVTPTKVINNQWEISEEKASYLLGSGIPGREGNVVIYGHNKNHLFGPIRWLGKDEEIKVINKKEEEFIYKIKETKTVSPETVEVLASTEDATLTLYTCTGFLDRERFVVIAKLQPE